MTKSASKIILLSLKLVNHVTICFTNPFKPIAQLHLSTNDIITAYSHRSESEIPQSDCVRAIEQLKKSQYNLLRLATAFSLLNIKPSQAAGPVGVGYKSIESVYAPKQPLYVIPLLAQSALLNSLPIENDLIAEIQAYLESFVQLINPSPRQNKQILTDDSLLWVNLRINAQRAAEMFVYNQEQLIPAIKPTSDVIYPDLDEWQKFYFEELKKELIQLVNVSRNSLVEDSIFHMRNALNDLNNVAYLQCDLNVSKIYDIYYPSPSESNPFSNSLMVSTEYRDVPRLFGRATVRLIFERPGPMSIIPLGSNVKSRYIRSRGSSKDTASDMVEVVLLVDGLNHPLTGGNFIDLCQQHFYDNLPVKMQTLEFDEPNEKIDIKVFGQFGDSKNPRGYIDPLTGKQRRIPLEVLREDENGNRFTALGAARNSAVFTNAEPVLSFATNGAIGMYHSKGDRNGASSAIFWIKNDQTKPKDGSKGGLSPTEINEEPVIQRLNNKYSLFAYVISGNDILEQLQPGDILVNAKVDPGPWKLIQIESEEERIVETIEEEFTR